MIPSLSGIVDVPPSPAPAAASPTSKKKKSTVKKFSAKNRASPGAKQSVAGCCRWLEADLGAVVAGGSAGNTSSPAVRLSPALVHSPVSTARKSPRRRDNGEPIMEGAKRRATAKDLCPPYTSFALSGSFGSSFPPR